MNVYVLIKTEMDEEFNFHTTVCGVYTKEGKERFEQSLPEKGGELKEQLRQGHIENINWFSEMLSRRTANKIDAFNNIMERKVEDAKRSLLALDDYQTDEQLKKFYMYQEGYSWQEELLIDN